MNTVSPETRPIGHWLKRLHDLLEHRFDELFGAQGITRRHWQCLHLLSDRGTTTVKELTAALAPFRGDDGPGPDEIVDELIERGWIRFGPDTLALTADGRAGHDTLAEQVDRLRATVTTDVTDEQYLTTVRTLAAMVDNLGGDAELVSARPTATVAGAQVEHVVPDLDAALDFYRRLTGLPEHRFRFMDADAAAIGPFWLWVHDSPRSKADVATLYTRDLDTTVAVATAAGARVVTPITGGMPGRYCVLVHPDGGAFRYVSY